MNENGWDRYKLLILENQREVKESLDNLREDVIQLRVMVEGLRVKASFWGALAGLLAGGAIAALWRRIVG